MNKFDELQLIVIFGSIICALITTAIKFAIDWYVDPYGEYRLKPKDKEDI